MANPKAGATLGGAAVRTWKLGRSVKTFFAMLGVLLLGLLVGGGAMWVAMPKEPVVAIASASKNQQVVDAIVREEQVVLLSLGIQGIATKEQHAKLFGADVPGTGRQVYLQYSYRAKLGLDGRQVKVSQTGDKAFKVTVPDFQFIGHDNEEFKTIVEKNGVLSQVTPQIDKVQLINEVLNDDTKKQQVSTNRQWLEEQARSFYDGIIHAIDPSIRVDYEYTRP